MLEYCALRLGVLALLYEALQEREQNFVLVSAPQLRQLFNLGLLAAVKQSRLQYD